MYIYIYPVLNIIILVSILGETIYKLWVYSLKKSIIY